MREYVRTYTICQRYKLELVATPGLIQPFPIPQYVFSDVSMDFIEGLPNSNRNNVTKVVVDRLTKYAHFMTMAHPYTTLTMA